VTMAFMLEPPLFADHSKTTAPLSSPVWLKYLAQRTASQRHKDRPPGKASAADILPESGADRIY
jgi:hypothetical protein